MDIKKELNDRKVSSNTTKFKCEECGFEDHTIYFHDFSSLCMNCCIRKLDLKKEKE